VTFFFNGAWKPRLSSRPDPDPVTDGCADLQPQAEMSAPRLTDEVIKAIRGGYYDVIICNFANSDMVGHTGDFDATVKAIEAVDQCLGHIYKAIMDTGSEMLITADHGNAEQMFDFETGQPHTAHTTNPVPFLYIGRPATLAPNGALEISRQPCYISWPAAADGNDRPAAGHIANRTAGDCRESRLTDTHTRLSLSLLRRRYRYVAIQRYAEGCGIVLLPVIRRPSTRPMPPTPRRKKHDCRNCVPVLTPAGKLKRPWSARRRARGSTRPGTTHRRPGAKHKTD
jgi:hypothetical protein